MAGYGADEISLALVQRVLGSAPAAVVAQVAQSLLNRDIPTGLRAINEAFDQGAEPRQFLSEILDYLRALLLLCVGAGEVLDQVAPDSLREMRTMLGTESPLGLLMRAVKLFGEAGQGLRTALRPQLPLELAFIEAIVDTTSAVPSPTAMRQEQGVAGPRVVDGGAAPRRVAPPPAAPVEALPPAVEGSRVAEQETVFAKTVVPAETEEPALAAEAIVAESKEPTAATAVAQSVRSSESAVDSEAPTEGAVASEQGLSLEWVQGRWNMVLLKTGPQSHQLRALLNSAYPIAVRDDVVTLACEAEFHRGKIAEEKRRDLIEAVMSEVLGTAVRIECTVDSSFRELGRTAPQTTEGTQDLFTAGDSTASAREDLLNHPAVRALQERGAQVTKVSLHVEDETGG